MTGGQTPTSVAAAVMAAFRDSSLFLGAGVSVGLFSAITLIPIFGVLFGVFTPVPLVYFYFRRGRIFGLTMIGVAAMAVAVLSTTILKPFGVLFFLEYAVLAAFMAEGFGRGHSPEKLVGYPALAIITLALSMLGFSSLVAGQNPLSFGRTMIERQIRASLQVYEAVLTGQDLGERPSEPSGARDRQTELDRGEKPAVARPERAPSSALVGMTKFLVGIFPGLMVMGALLVAWANFMLGRLLLFRAAGLPIRLADLKRWRSPEGMVWVTIGCGFGLFIPLGWLKVMALNGLMVLGLIYFLQGLCILSFWMDKKRVPPLFRAMVYTLIALQQYLVIMLATLGLFDMWLDIRRLNKAVSGPEA